MQYAYTDAALLLRTTQLAVCSVSLFFLSLFLSLSSLAYLSSTSSSFLSACFWHHSVESSRDNDVLDDVRAYAGGGNTIRLLTFNDDDDKNDNMSL